MKLLIVDDKADMRRLVRFTLDSQYEVLEAASGREALRCIRREKPQLMLLDVVMPRMDGIAVLRAARKLDPSISVMMLTADYSMDVARSALEHGARSYITKPFDPEALCGEVRRLMEGPAGKASVSSGRPWRVQRGGVR